MNMLYIGLVFGFLLGIPAGVYTKIWMDKPDHVVWRQNEINKSMNR